MKKMFKKIVDGIHERWTRERLILGLLAEYGESTGLQLVYRSGDKLKRGSVYVQLVALIDGGYVTSRTLPPSDHGVTLDLDGEAPRLVQSVNRRAYTMTGKKPPWWTPYI